MSRAGRFLLAHPVLLRALHRPTHRGQDDYGCLVCRICVAALLEDPEFVADLGEPAI